MSYYKTPADMFSSRAERAMRDANRQFEKAERGYGDRYYDRAAKSLDYAEHNIYKTREARESRATFGRKKSLW